MNFISHAQDAEPAADALAERLEARGHETFLDFRDTGKAGQSWTEDVSHALAEAEAVVVLVGDEVSAHERREWRMALEASWADPGLRLVPVALGKAELPAWLRQIQTARVDSDGTAGDRWQDAVLKAIEHPTRRVAGEAGKWHARLDAVVRRAEELEGGGD